jgi:hypothetical protein
MANLTGVVHVATSGILLPPQGAARIAGKSGKTHNVFQMLADALPGAPTSIGMKALTK